MNCITAFFPAIKLAVIAFIIVYLLSLLNLIPTWNDYREIIIPILLVLTIRGIGFLIFKSLGNCVLVGSIIFILTLVISFFLFYLSSDPIMSGEELIESKRDNNSGDMIFVYEYSEIPNGFIKSIVTVQSSWLPIEKNILEVSSSFSDLFNRDGNLVLSFDSDNSHQYIYMDGEFKQVIKDEGSNAVSCLK